MNSQWDGCVRSKLNTVYVILQKTYGHQNKQGAVLYREVPIRRTTWTFNRVTNVTIWKSSLFIIKRVMSSKPVWVFTCDSGFRMQRLQSLMASCSIFFCFSSLFSDEQSTGVIIHSLIATLSACEQDRSDVMCAFKQSYLELNSTYRLK